MLNEKFINVQIERKFHQKLRDYSKISGIKIVRLYEFAINHYMKKVKENEEKENE